VSVVAAACVVAVVVVVVDVVVEFDVVNVDSDFDADVTSSNSADVVVVVVVVVVVAAVAVVVVVTVVSGTIVNESNASIQLDKSIVGGVGAGEFDGSVTMLGAEVGLIPVGADAVAAVPFCDGMAVLLVDDSGDNTIISSVGGAIVDAPFDWKGASTSVVGDGLR
jgi:hypothetical protein